jgi:hypothetical protein
MVAPALKNPPPSLVSRELLTNQVAEDEMSWKLLTPLELNWPWAKNWLPVVLRETISEVFCAQEVLGLVTGFCVQMRTAMRVIGVEVGSGGVVLVPPPQLSSSVVITKASTGAIIKHLVRHMKHTAMPWQLRRCQAKPVQNSLRVIARKSRSEWNLSAREAGKRNGGHRRRGEAPRCPPVRGPPCGEHTRLLGGGRNQGAVRDYQLIGTHKVRR